MLAITNGGCIEILYICIIDLKKQPAITVILSYDPPLLDTIQVSFNILVTASHMMTGDWRIDLNDNVFFIRHLYNF